MKSRTRLTNPGQMFALDQSIVATAIPIVASQFQAFAEVPWLITAYFVSLPPCTAASSTHNLEAAVV